MKFVVESDLTKCKVLWEKFSPYNTLWDEWETVFSFFNDTIHLPHFVLLYERQKLVGILPLMYEHPSNRHLYFGGEYIENLHFWFDLQYFADLWQYLPNTTKLYDINATTFNHLISTSPDLTSFSEEVTSHAYVDISSHSNFRQYLTSFSKKHRKNLWYDIQQVEKQVYDISWNTQVTHFDTFVEFNKQRFGEESDFVDPIFTIGMHDFLTSLSKKKKLHCVVIADNKKVIGLEYATLHNNVYYVLNGGYDLAYKNLGKYLIYLQFQKAYILKCTSIDFLSGNDQWKKLWNLQMTPYYTLVKSKVQTDHIFES